MTAWLKEFKIIKIDPLHKEGSKSILGNCRPISILSSINKDSETVLRRRLVDYWEKYTLHLMIINLIFVRNIPLILP